MSQWHITITILPIGRCVAGKQSVSHCIVFFVPTFRYKGVAMTNDLYDSAARLVLPPTSKKVIKFYGLQLLITQWHTAGIILFIKC